MQTQLDPIQGNYFKDFLDVLFKRKAVILLFFLATLLTAVIGVSFFQKVKYEAYSKIFIETSRGYVSERSLPTNDPRRRNTEGPSLAQQVDLALQVLKDNELTNRVVKKIGPNVIYEDIEKPDLKNKLLLALGLRSLEDQKALPVTEMAALRLQDELIVGRTSKNSSIIYVSLRHKDPEVAANVVNSVVDLYFERHLGLRKKPRLSRFFQEQFAAKKAAMVGAERNFQEYMDSYGMTSSPEKSIGFLLAQKEKNQTKLDEAVSQEAELVNQIRLLRQQLANTAKNPKAINTLQEKLLELQIREGELSTHYTDHSRTMKNLRTEIQQTQKKLEELGYNKRYIPKSLSSASSLYGDLREKLLQTELALNSLKARRESITAQLAEYDTRIKKLDGLETEFLRREEELSMARKSYRLYQTKFEEFRISDALDAEGIANIKVLDVARVPLNPIPPKTALILLLSCFFGAVGGLGLALFIELTSGTLKKREDTEQYLKRPVLATIPEYTPDDDANRGMQRGTVL
ncbi:MAG: GNVR domain-containing protein [Pseudomonadota bacterium]